MKIEKTLLKKFGLQKWFDDTFDKNEKKILLDSCPLFSMNDGEFNSDSPTFFLADSLQWYNKKDNVVICMKAVKEVLHLLNEEKSFDVLDLHFIYLNLINTLYRHRDFEGAFPLCVDMCNRQIEIAPKAAKAFVESPSFTGMPSHTGFEQLAIIEKKNKNWVPVLELCENAKAQGWAGDWDKRIAEAKKHIEWQN